MFSKKILLLLFVFFVVFLSWCFSNKDVCVCDNIEKQEIFEKNIECENRLNEFIASLEQNEWYDYGKFASFYSPETESCIFKYSYDRSTPKFDPQYRVFDVLVDTESDAYYEESTVVFQDEKEIHSCLYFYDFPKASWFNGRVCDVDLEVEYLLTNKAYCVCPMSWDIIKKNNAICENWTNNMRETYYSWVEKYDHEKWSFYSPILNRCLQWESYWYLPSKFENDTWARFWKATWMVFEYRIWSPLGLPTFSITDRWKKWDYDLNGIFIPTIGIMDNKELSAEEYLFKSIDFLKSNPIEKKLFWDAMRYMWDLCGYFDSCVEWVNTL